MADLRITRHCDHRPRMDMSAPWSPLQKTTGRKDGRAVVYVVAAEQGRICKIGRTSQLKKRLGDLQRVYGDELHVQFWVECSADESKAVEQKALTYSDGDSYKLPEWRITTPQQAALDVLEACRVLGVRPVAMAGLPGMTEPEMTEVQQVMNEPFVDHGHGKTGATRLPRHLW